MELMVNCPHILKIGKLNFSEELFGRIYHPTLYTEKTKDENNPEPQNIVQQERVDLVASIPEDVRTQMQRLTEL